jgi:hypothetical protein
MPQVNLIVINAREHAHGLNAFGLHDQVCHSSRRTFAFSSRKE